jgi:transcriptional regulator with PAS, ATPase and Fis domain
MSLNLELHPRELLLFPILQNIDEGIIITDTLLNVTFFNENAEKIYGIEASQIIGKSADTLKPKLNLHTLCKDRQRFAKAKELINGNEVLISKGLLEISPDSFISYAILHIIDTFEEKQLNSLLQSPYEGIIVFDDKSHLLYANDTCYRFLGCKSKNELFERLSSIIPRTSLDESLQTARPVSGELLNIRGHSVKLVYLPIVRYNRSVGVIVKSTLVSHFPRGTAIIKEKTERSSRYYLDSIVGNNKSIIEQKYLATRAARTVSTVLITGESGTGKEIFAHAIHNISPRRKGPFVKVNCAAVPETLLESELFGYAEGAFTGALKEGKPGKFELANHGTIFLDEIADMSLSMQAKLLRVLQEKEVERVGSVRTTRVDVRIIAASNQDLNQLVAENKFREDLFYRLNVIILNLSPLRERTEDIPLISNELLKRLNRQLGTKVESITDEVLHCFGNYRWPGNIRELENTIERAINFCDGNTINIEHIPEHICSQKAPLPAITAGTLEKSLQQFEKTLIINTLQVCDGNRSKTAKALNIHRSVLYRKMNKYNISCLE